MRRGPLALRATTALALCAWLIGQGSTVAHHALVPHAVCAEHGDIVDASGSGHAATHVDRAEAEPFAGVAIGNAHALGPEDAHCSVVGCRPDRSALVLIEARTIDPACVAPIACTPRTTKQADARARYRLAPKTSPPA